MAFLHQGVFPLPLLQHHLLQWYVSLVRRKEVLVPFWRALQTLFDPLVEETEVLVFEWMDYCALNVVCLSEGPWIERMISEEDILEQFLDVSWCVEPYFDSWLGKWLLWLEEKMMQITCFGLLSRSRNNRFKNDFLITLLSWIRDIEYCVTTFSFKAV